jgi:spoIIIJ-associated protein
MGHEGSVFEGRTLDDAVRKGLEALGRSRAEVMITILEEGSGGFLGLGARPYRVRVMPRPGGAFRDAGERETRRVRARPEREGRREGPRDRNGRRDRGPRREERGPRIEARGERDRGGRSERGARERGEGGRGEPVRGEPVRSDERPRGEPRRGGRDRDDRGPRGGMERGPERTPERGEERGPERGFERGPERGYERGEGREEPREARPMAPEETPARGFEEGGERRPRRRSRRGGRGRDEGAGAPTGAPMHATPRPERPERHAHDDEGARHAGVASLEDRGPGLSAEELAANGQRVTEELFKTMGFEATVTARAEGDHVDVAAAVGEGEDLLTGRKGEVRQALQHLLNRMLNRGEGSRYHLQLEINEFWQHREDELRALARQLAEEALASNGEAVTEYLNAQERRIVHVTLKEDTRVKTYALGTGLIKRVAVAPADYPEGPRSD